MSTISASDSESQPPLEVLIIALTFSFDTSTSADFISDVLNIGAIKKPANIDLALAQLGIIEVVRADFSTPQTPVPR